MVQAIQFIASQINLRGGLTKPPSFVIMITRWQKGLNMYAFDKWRAENSEALDSDLIYGKFTRDQLQILFSWIESGYEAGFDDGYDDGREY